MIDPDRDVLFAKTDQGRQYGFIKDDFDVFLLPSIGYAGGMEEVKEIKTKVVADNENMLSKKEIDDIVDAIELRFSNRLALLATRSQVTQLDEDTKKAIEPLATKAGVSLVLNAVDELRSLVQKQIDPIRRLRL